MTETFRKQLVQRLSRSFLDILILRLIQTEPMWGYKIIKKSKKLFGIQLGHGKLYPLLNSLNNEGFLASKKTIKGGRTLKVYKITPKGKQFVETY
ncbi:PadR family transcriptional regulator, partial [Candidatus Bathyarchaeota archaeon]|nr:PadR family transcriptional regulator [Candidatus Bathyarchaeota archaeon]